MLSLLERTSKLLLIWLIHFTPHNFLHLNQIQLWNFFRLCCCLYWFCQYKQQLSYGQLKYHGIAFFTCNTAKKYAASFIFISIFFLLFLNIFKLLFLFSNSSMKRCPIDYIFLNEICPIFRFYCFFDRILVLSHSCLSQNWNFSVIMIYLLFITWIFLLSWCLQVLNAASALIKM
jgi:hypothetical protein